MIHADSDYAIARLHARCGRRLRDDQWRKLSGARSLAAALDSLRGGSAARWIEGIGVHTDAHAIEARLRASFRAQIAELAGWADASWQAALQWCAVLVDLPALRHARASGAPAPATGAALLQTLDAGPDADVEDCWRQQLRRRLPRLDTDARGELDRLEGQIDAHRRRFCQLAAGNGWPEREALQRALLARMRRVPINPVLMLIWVALLLLDYEHVRGELLRLSALHEGAPA